MRRLTFGESNDSKKFSLCYQALVFAQAPLARNELRTHGSLLTKLEAIGEPANPGRKPDDVELWHCPAGGSILLEDAEYLLLRRFLEALAPAVHRSLTRELDRAIVQLEALAEVGAQA